MRSVLRRNISSLLALILFSTSCTLIARNHLPESGNPPIPPRIEPVRKLSKVSLQTWVSAKHVLDSRCIVCHSCYDAPCQLKLTSPQGIDRGASKQVVYDTTRLIATEPTRLGVDAQTTAEWRQKEFSPILNEQSAAPLENLEGSVLYRMLDLKRQNPFPANEIIKNDIDFSLDREQVCPNLSEMQTFEKRHPLWGMPFGFPALSADEFSAVRRWLEAGAVMPAKAPLPEKLSQAVMQWETFLNGHSLKEQLMSRYLYEHLFLGNLVFDTVDEQQSFKLVRSSTPPGEPLVILTSRRPNDDPGAPFFYRLQVEEETTVEKTRMAYALNPQRMERYRTLFLDTPYTVTSLPSYDRKLASNPFKVFQQIPPIVRYRFLLDEAQYFVMGFIKGPVCRGQVALNVIDDQFWVFFANPEIDTKIEDGDFLARENDKLSLPGEWGSTTSALLNWRRYEKQQKKYLKAKRENLQRFSSAGLLPTLNIVWNGDGNNTNAALTIFRHFDSATVLRGMVGAPPKTAWLIGYPMLERIHYLLVSDYDVFGNVGHQLLTRLYMDFLRVEGENNFLVLLPKNIRKNVHDSWYRGIGGTANDYTLSPKNFDWTETGIAYHSSDPKNELFEKIHSYLGSALSLRHELKKNLPPELKGLADINGIAASVMPELSYLRIRGQSRPAEVYTVVANRGLKNVAILYLEKTRRVPQEDTLTVIPGIVGAYPNAFYDVDRGDLETFVARVSKLESESDYRALMEQFGVRRTTATFWQFSDWIQQEHRRESDHEVVLDYSRFENR